MDLERLEDRDYPVATMGQAAELLGVQPAFLRSLDTAGLLHPHRSGGGHRRYSRRQLDYAAAIRALSQQGHTIAGAAAVVELREDLAAAHRDLASVQQQRDAAEQERAAAEYQRDAAEQQREAAEQERDAAEEQRDIALTERDQARADLTRAHRALDRLNDVRTPEQRRH